MQVNETISASGLHNNIQNWGTAPPTERHDDGAFMNFIGYHAPVRSIPPLHPSHPEDHRIMGHEDVLFVLISIRVDTGEEMEKDDDKWLIADNL